MARVCLINPLGNDVDLICSPPLGLAYIAAVLEKESHDVLIIDRVAMLSRNSNRGINFLNIKMQLMLQDFDPDFIGISAMSIQVYDLDMIIKIIRSTPMVSKSVIIVGGFHATSEPNMTLKEFPEIDILCRGEGEFVIKDLVSDIALDQIDGISYVRDGKVCSTPDRESTRDLDIFPMPARHLLDMDYYLRQGDAVISCVPAKAITMLTSRGCPYNCKFCSSKVIFKSHRYHSIDYVVDEIEYLVASYKFDHISFVDSTMLPRRDRLEDLCKRLIYKKLNNKFKWGCCLRPDLIDKDILKLMHEAGCIFVNYGFESGSQHMLDLMNKKDTVADNARAAKLTTEAGILVNSAFIVNVPHETESDIENTINFLKDNQQYIYSTGINTLLPLPGSPYYDELIRDGTLLYSDKLWGEIAVLPKSIETVRLYNDIPRDRFIDLYTKAVVLAKNINMSNYVERNLFKHPLYMTKKVLNVLRKEHEQGHN